MSKDKISSKVLNDVHEDAMTGKPMLAALLWSVIGGTAVYQAGKKLRMTKLFQKG